MEKKSIDVFEFFQIATTCGSSIDRDLKSEGWKTYKGNEREETLQVTDDTSRRISRGVVGP